jgi:hypothetical protein
MSMKSLPPFASTVSVRRRPEQKVAHVAAGDRVVAERHLVRLDEVDLGEDARRT